MMKVISIKQPETVDKVENSQNELIESTTSSKLTEVQDILKSCEDSQKNRESSFEPLRFPGISEILPTLYLCGAGVATPSVMEQLGIKFVINIAPELPDTPLPDNKPLYLRVNASDRSDVDLKLYFDEVADMIEEVRESGGKSLVHCVAGVSRSASMCIAYVMKYLGLTLADSYRHVKKARPQIRPNLGFFRQLMKYEEEIRNEQTVKMIYCASLDKEIPDVFEPEYRAMEEFYQRCRQYYQRRS